MAEKPSISDPTTSSARFKTRMNTHFSWIDCRTHSAIRVGTSATTKISRKDFGLVWNAILETGGVALSDEVKITLDVQFIRKT